MKVSSSSYKLPSKTSLPVGNPTGAGLFPSMNKIPHPFGHTFLIIDVCCAQREIAGNSGLVIIGQIDKMLNQ